MNVSHTLVASTVRSATVPDPLQASPDLLGASDELYNKNGIMTTWLQEWGAGNCDPKRFGWPAA